VLLDEQIVSRHRADLIRRIIHLRQNPGADAFLALKTLQAARPIRILRSKNVVPTAVVINLGVRPGRIGAKSMIVQHARSAVVTDGADQVAKVLMQDRVGHHDAFHVNLRFGNRKNVGLARMPRGAVGNVHRQRHAEYDLVAVLVPLAERRLAEDCDESIFRPLLRFRLHADIIDIAAD